MSKNNPIGDNSRKRAVRKKLKKIQGIMTEFIE